MSFAVLLRLIDSLLVKLSSKEICERLMLLQKFNNINYISGPTELVYLKKDDKKVLMFGDEHFSDEGHCPYEDGMFTEDYLNIMFQVNPHIEYDLFIEMAIQSKHGIESYTKGREIDPMGRMISTFEDYAYKYKKSSNIRVHYSDMRRVDLLFRMNWLGVINIDTYDPRTKLFMKSSYFEIQKILNYDIQTVKGKLNNLKTKEGFIEEWLNILYDNYMLNKELNKFNKKKELIEFISDYLIKVLYNPYKTLLLEFIKLYNKYDHNIYLHNPKLIKEMNVFFAIYTASFVDVYVISRMSKEYMKNIILYFGFSHIKLYAKFLLDVLGYEFVFMKESTEDNKKCINITDVKHEIILHKK